MKLEHVELGIPLESYRQNLEAGAIQLLLRFTRVEHFGNKHEHCETNFPSISTEYYESL